MGSYCPFRDKDSIRLSKSFAVEARGKTKARPIPHNIHPNNRTISYTNLGAELDEVIAYLVRRWLRHTRPLFSKCATP